MNYLHYYNLLLVLIAEISKYEVDKYTYILIKPNVLVIANKQVDFLFF